MKSSIVGNYSIVKKKWRYEAFSHQVVGISVKTIVPAHRSGPWPLASYFCSSTVNSHVFGCLVVYSASAKKQDPRHCIYYSTGMNKKDQLFSSAINNRRGRDLQGAFRGGSHSEMRAELRGLFSIGQCQVPAGKTNMEVCTEVLNTKKG